MGDYTPTTSDVRVVYADAVGDFDGFDRWLAARDREVAERAWDEGAKDVMDGYAIPGDPGDGNPYRLAPSSPVGPNEGNTTNG